MGAGYPKHFSHDGYEYVGRHIAFQLITDDFEASGDWRLKSFIPSALIGVALR